MGRVKLAKLSSSEERGSFMVATAAIRPGTPCGWAKLAHDSISDASRVGQTILKVRPIAAALNSENLQTTCSACFRDVECIAPLKMIPCSTCKTVTYCGAVRCLSPEHETCKTE